MQIENGNKGQIVATQHAVMLYEKLEKILGKEKVILHVLEGVQHGGKEIETPENLQIVFSFLDKILK